jgi:hypothetical protein
MTEKTPINTNENILVRFQPNLGIKLRVDKAPTIYAKDVPKVRNTIFPLDNRNTSLKYEKTSDNVIIHTPLPNP